MPKKYERKFTGFNVPNTIARLIKHLLNAKDDAGLALKDFPPMRAVVNTPVAAPGFIASAQISKHVSRPQPCGCRECSAAKVLLRLVQHQAEVERDGLGPVFVEFAKHAEEASQALSFLLAASSKLQPAVDVQLKLAKHFGKDGVPRYANLHERRASMHRLAEQLLTLLPPLQREVEKMSRSPELWEAARAKRKPRNLLLGEITWALYEGGFSHAEIAALVDDGSEQAGPVARVRERLRTFKKFLRENPAGDLV